jgi:hypothetical protein
LLVSEFYCRIAIVLFIYVRYTNKIRVYQEKEKELEKYSEWLLTISTSTKATFQTPSSKSGAFKCVSKLYVLFWDFSETWITCMYQIHRNGFIIIKTWGRMVIIHMPTTYIEEKSI